MFDARQIPHYTRVNDLCAPKGPFSKAVVYKMANRGEVTLVRVNGMTFSPESADEIIHRLSQRPEQSGRRRGRPRKAGLEAAE